MEVSQGVGSPPGSGPGAGREAQEELDFDQSLLEERRARTRSRSALVWSLRIAALVAAGAGWWLFGAIGVISTGIIGDPVQVLKQLGDWATTSYLWTNIWSTFKAALIGLAVGSLAGIAVGVVFARVTVIRRAFNPYVTFFNAMPRPALAPLFVVWFGLGVVAKVTGAFSIVFFIMLVNTIAGIENVDPDVEQFSRSLGISGRQFFLMVELPTALPTIYSGLRLSAAGAVLGVIVDEIVAAYRGLGQIFVRASSAFDMNQVYAIVIVISLVAVVLDLLAWLIQKSLTKR